MKITRLAALAALFIATPRAQESAGMEMPLHLPIGSGTTWLPASSPVHEHAFHLMAGGWMIMAHGELNARYIAENFDNTGKWNPGPAATAGEGLYPGKERGGDKWDLPNWAMVSADRAVLGSDRLLFRVMMSLDPLTEGREGYPLLYQTGEGLADRQHAHDLFMEAAALYNHHFSETQRAYLYLGLPGEPALGPTAFMHRPSASPNPESPLAHHSQDATHITYGVATLGWIAGDFKLEASAFRGREPDADRWDIEAPGFDSYSLRVAYALGDAYVVQASSGYLQDAEPDEPGVDLVRSTASVEHNLKMPGGNDWANAAILGNNLRVHGPARGGMQSATLESSLGWARAMAWGRWESVERMAAELDLPGDPGRFFWIHRLTAGLGGTVVKAVGLDFFLGGQASIHFAEDALEPYYGSWPLSGSVFLKVRPSAPRGAAHHHGMHEGMDMEDGHSM